jgi:MFS family permease
MPSTPEPTHPTRPAPPGTRGLGAGFTNLFTANIASSLGDGIARTAIPLLGARLTDDPLLIAGIAALALLPWLFFAIPSGILIDRMDRRIALALAQAVRVALGVLLIVLVATGLLTIWWLYVVVFVYGAFETLYDGAVRAVAPSIVQKRNLPRANSRIEAGELVVQNFVAGPFTSLLFALAVLVPLGVNALAFALAGVLALLLPKAASGRQHAHADDEGVRWYRQFADGFRFIRSSPMLLKLWIVTTLGGLFFSFGTGSMVLWILGPVGVPEAWFGVFMLSGAVGGVIGSIAAPKLKTRFGAGPVMASALVVDGLALALMGVAPNVVPVAAGFLISSAGILVFNVLIMSLRQAAVPGHLLGRVHGTWRTLLWGTMPLGTMLGGFVARIDLALPFLIGGGVCVVIAVITFGFMRSLPNPEDLHPDGGGSPSAHTA